MHRKIFKNLLAVTAGLMMAAGLVVMGGNSIPANIVEASDLTLATDASKVTYRTTTAEEIAILKKLFDVEYYKAQNPELWSFWAVVTRHFLNTSASMEYMKEGPATPILILQHMHQHIRT